MTLKVTVRGHPNSVMSGERLSCTHKSTDGSVSATDRDISTSESPADPTVLPATTSENISLSWFLKNRLTDHRYLE